MGNPLAIYPALKNARSYTPRSIQSRPGASLLVSSGSSPLHSCRRLNDPTRSAYSRVCGSGSSLYAGSSSLSLIESGYSGNPLSLIATEPYSSPQPWMYVMDAVKGGRKINSLGQIQSQGIAPPLSAPAAYLASDSNLIIEAFNESTVGSWTAGGTASLLAAGGATSMINTTINKIISFPNGTFVSIAPAAMGTAFVPGVAITLNTGQSNAETVLIQSVFPSVGSTTIGSIQYDSGTSGLCTIAAGVSSPGPFSETLYASLSYFQPGAMIQFTSNLEVVLILSVTNGPGGNISFRCSTTGTHAAGETISGVSCFSCSPTKSHAASETIEAGFFSFQVATAADPWGHIQLIKPFDFTTLKGRTVLPDDDFVICVAVDNPSNIIEGRVWFDLDPTTHDFLHNSIYFAFQPSALQGAGTEVQTTLQSQQQAVLNAQTQIAYENIYDSGAAAVIPQFTPPGYLGTTAAGNGAWTPLFITVSGISGNRIGYDTNLNLSNVQAISLHFGVTGTINVQVSSFSLGGTYGPTVGGVGSAYYYRYRGKSSVTGAISNPSPATRAGVIPRNQLIGITGPFHPDPQVDTIVVERFGGTLTNWLPVAYIPNPSSGNWTAYDGNRDSDISSLTPLSESNYVPFPLSGLPVSGTCNVAGTSVQWVSGAQFNTNWAPGTIITIGGQQATLFSQPTSSTRLFLAQSLGTYTGAAFTVPNPTLLGQAMLTMWGPYGEGNSGLTLFSASGKDGNLYWTNGNDPDSASDKNYVAVTGGSEIVLNGGVYQDQPFCFTTRRIFRFVPDFSNPGAFLGYDEGSGYGLMAPWAMCVGPLIYFLTWDGIRENGLGGISKSITDPDLTLLFPHDMSAAVPVSIGGTVVYPPDFTQTTKLRLSWANSHLYFDYQDVNGIATTLVWNPITRSWSLDTFSTTFHYADEAQGSFLVIGGSTDGNLYQFLSSNSTDGSTGAAIPFEVRMPTAGDYGKYQVTGSDAFIAGNFPNGATLVIDADSQSSSISVPSTSGYQRQLVNIASMKGKSWTWNLTATAPAELYLRDTMLSVKDWAQSEYRPLQPFRDLMREARP